MDVLHLGPAFLVCEPLIQPLHLLDVLLGLGFAELVRLSRLDVVQLLNGFGVVTELGPR